MSFSQPTNGQVSGGRETNGQTTNGQAADDHARDQATNGHGNSLVSERQYHGEQAASTPQKKERHFLSRYPLRVSLVVVITILAALGLTGFSAVITTNLQRILVEQVDNQLDSATQTWAHETTDPNLDDWSRNPNEQGSVPGNSGAARPPSEFYVRVVDGDYAVETFNSVFDSLPDVSSLTEPSAPKTVNARPGSASPAPWRAASVRNADGTVTIVALSLEGEEHTIARIVFFQVVVGIIVLTLLMAASMYIVRRALRPLNEVEVTASLISRGQLGQRVPQGNPRTEVGRLSEALNRMLQQIQGAFVAVAASERQARKSEASMRRFIGDASHELRTPLTSVRGYAELYTSGATDDANLVVGKISEEAGRMSLLVEDLLALVRMDEGRPMRQDRVDMLELVLATAESTRAAFPGRTVNVSNQCGCVPVVVGDSARLHQVLGNLLTNSMRHAGEDAETEVVLKTDQKLAPNSLVIEVNDNGNGIPEKDLPHLFDRFYRPDVSRSRQSGGSGLGLSIVKGLVEKHGGSISVRSELGEGTSFRILLPRAPEVDGSGDDVDESDRVHTTGRGGRGDRDGRDERGNRGNHEGRESNSDRDGRDGSDGRGDRDGRADRDGRDGNGGGRAGNGGRAVSLFSNQGSGQRGSELNAPAAGHGSAGHGSAGHGAAGHGSAVHGSAGSTSAGTGPNSSAGNAGGVGAAGAAGVASGGKNGDQHSKWFTGGKVGDAISQAMGNAKRRAEQRQQQKAVKKAAQREEKARTAQAKAQMKAAKKADRGPEQK